MPCSECGTENDPGAKFCMSCGSGLGGAMPAPPAAPPADAPPPPPPPTVMSPPPVGDEDAMIEKPAWVPPVDFTPIEVSDPPDPVTWTPPESGDEPAEEQAPAPAPPRP